jgi:hypothetical protein
MTFFNILGGPLLAENLMIGVGMPFVLVVQGGKLMALDIEYFRVGFPDPGRGPV